MKFPYGEMCAHEFQFGLFLHGLLLSIFEILNVFTCINNNSQSESILKHGRNLISFNSCLPIICAIKVYSLKKVRTVHPKYCMFKCDVCL